VVFFPLMADRQHGDHGCSLDFVQGYMTGVAEENDRFVPESVARVGLVADRPATR